MGTVVLSSWMVRNGYSHDLQQRYKRSGWFQPIGSGAMKRSNDRVGYEGAVYALQQQAGMSIHPGAWTAMTLLGKAHHLEHSKAKAVLFGCIGEKLPAWFRNHDWGLETDYHESGFLPKGVGMTEVGVRDFSLAVSGAARAMMECIHLATEEQDLIDCMHLMEGLNNLHPGTVQSLLEQCRSIKVKRLFLYLAGKSGHAWFGLLDRARLDLGRGKRSLVQNGVFVGEYGITVPREWETDERDL